MAIQQPKLDWKAGDVLLPSDFNRIEGNIYDLDVRVQGNTSSISQLQTNLSNLQQTMTEQLSIALAKQFTDTKAFSGTSFIPDFLISDLGIGNITTGGIVAINDVYAFLFHSNGVNIIKSTKNETWIPKSSFTSAGWSEQDFYKFILSVGYNGMFQDWGFLYGEALGTIYGIELWKLFQKSPGSSPKKARAFGGYGGTLKTVTTNKVICAVSDEYNNAILIFNADLSSSISGNASPLVGNTYRLVDNAEFYGTDVIMYAGKPAQNAKTDRLCLMNAGGQVIDVITFSSSSLIGNYLQRSSSGFKDFKTLANGLVLLALDIDNTKVALILFDALNRKVITNAEFDFGYSVYTMQLYYITNNLFALVVTRVTQPNPFTLQHTIYTVRIGTTIRVNWLYQFSPGSVQIEKIIKLNEGLFIQTGFEKLYNSVWIPLVR